MILYSADGTVALLRSNGSYGDLFVGADSDEQIDQLGELLEQVTWKMKTIYLKARYDEFIRLK